MRVISGSAKGIQLASVPGKSTRPITDQVKEALFNILGPEIEGATVLDLFGGTGAVGIEALSRGAEHVDFIEINYRALKVIQQNLKTTNLSKFATVQKKDAFVYLREDHQKRYDLIDIAPPQYHNLWDKAMQIVDENPDLVKPWGMVIVQIHPKEYNENNVYTKFRVFDQREYGDTLLVFYELAQCNETES
jgi:16S rRNA (guanine(966)-N(2))-methyltransferase RsmD